MIVQEAISVNHLKVSVIPKLDKLRLGGENLWDARAFCILKKTLDLQIFSRIGKTTKKLQWIPNTNAYLKFQ